MSSVGKAASHIYQRLNELVKKVGLIDIGVTKATKRWRHDFCISAIFSTSSPKLLKRPIVSYSLGVDLQDWKVLKNFMRAFSKKIGLNFSSKKITDLHYFLLFHRYQCYPDRLKQCFHHMSQLQHTATFPEGFIRFASLDF